MVIALNCQVIVAKAQLSQTEPNSGGGSLKSILTTRLIHGLSELRWKILEVVAGIQISVDVVIAESGLVKSKKEVYLISAFLLAFLAVTFPDRIPSILSSLKIDTTAASERTQGFVKEIRKLLPAF